MAKIKTRFVCQECGSVSPKWLGKCPSCNNWNTIVEEFIAKESKSDKTKAFGISIDNKPESILKVETKDFPRFSTGSLELDRVLGDGVVPASLVLMVGDPGIGKSSLILQVCAYIAERQGKVLYVTGEESVRQIKLRADRLNALNENLYILSESNLDLIEKYAIELEPKLLVIDSIQTVFRPDIQSAPGSVSQVRESAVQLLRLAKSNYISTFIVGHVTKEGSLAGPRVLEHIVDTVLYFEGDMNLQYRVLRAVKNRFGSTNEIGLFDMKAEGLIDVPNPSEMFLSERPINVAGSVVIPTIEGTRPLLVEIQALVSNSTYMQPRRTADGIDIKRIQLLLAVLEKRSGIIFSNCDVYAKVAGGITVDEPAIDLGLAVALASNLRNTCTDSTAAIFGEVGLAGEVRAVTHVEKRVREAEKMGFKKIILPKANLNNITKQTKINLIGVKSVSDGLKEAMS